MQIQWAIPCRYAEELDGVGNFLGAGTDTFWPAELPCTIDVVIAINMTVPEHELGHEAVIAIEVLDPDMKASDGGTIDVRAEDYEHRPPGRQPSLMGVVDPSVQAEKYGQYAITLTLQDRVTSIPIFVIPPPAD